MSDNKKGHRQQSTEDEELNPLQHLQGIFHQHVGRHIDKVRKGLAEWIHPEGERISDKHRSAPQHTNHNSEEEEYDDDEEEYEALPPSVERREAVKHHSAPSAPRPPPSTSSPPSVAESRNGGAPSRPSSHGSQATIAPASTDLSEEEKGGYTNLGKSFKDWTLAPFKEVTPIDIFNLYKLIDGNKAEEWVREQTKIMKKMKSNIETAQKNESKFEKWCNDFEKWHQKQVYTLQLAALNRNLDAVKDTKSVKAAQLALRTFEINKENQALANFMKPSHIPFKKT